jgi:NAD(P)-dependent dehydrogenase (short-subunit alcohol dehydrogenase family)
MKTVLIADADSALGRALCDELAAAGFGVIAHIRTGGHDPFPEAVTVVTADPFAEALTGWNETVAGIDHVVFGQAPEDAAVLVGEDGFEAMVASLDAGLSGFLAELQAVGKLLARKDGGQVWVLTREDSMRYYTRQPSNPIDARARHAAVKSFAKEVFRFGVRINCANVQLLAEQASAGEWKTARDGLKAFAMKFKPVKAAAVAGTLRRFLEQDDLPITGLIVPIGIGFAENNI